MTDRTTPPHAPPHRDLLVITPAIEVPADLPTRITEARAGLALLEPAVAALTERIGTEVMPTARHVWETSGAPAAVAEAFDARTGWRDLNSTLHRLAMALLCAAGEPDQPPEAPTPTWHTEPGPS